MRRTDGAVSAASTRHEAAHAALVPYPWRAWTAEMLARQLLGALDRHAVVRLVSSCPGACVGELPEARPIGSDDLRVRVLLDFLDEQRWRRLTLTSLCRHLLGALDAWSSRRDWVEAELRRLCEPS